jgi:hypothetical protein
LHEIALTDAAVHKNYMPLQRFAVPYFGQIPGFATIANHEPLRPPEIWRQLLLEVEPAGMAVYWGSHKECVGTVSAATRAKHGQNMAKFRKMTGVGPEYPHRGGLGLFVRRAEAAFRNVVVEPLDD